MSDVATHVRIFDADPSDDLVTKRIAAVNNLADDFEKNRGVDVLIAVGDGISRACGKVGDMPESLAVTVEQAIRNESTAFVRAGNELQLLVVALLALDHAITAATPAPSLSIVDVLANATWLALGFQAPSTNPKLEALRSEVLSNARSHCLRSASRARQRKPIEEVKVEAFAADLSDANAKFKTAIDGQLSALRDNAVLDREEIDFLWWALSDFSLLAKRQYSALGAPIAAIAAGLDGAQSLRRLPSEAHKHVVLRHVRGHSSLTLGELVAAVGDELAIFSPVFSSNRARKFPAVFGLLAALDRGGPLSGTNDKIPLADWASRAFGEAGFLRVMELLPGAQI